MTLTAKILEARTRALAQDRDPRFFILDPDQIDEFVEEIRLSRMFTIGFNRKKVREQVIRGDIKFLGMRPIISDQIAQ